MAWHSLQNPAGLLDQGIVASGERWELHLTAMMARTLCKCAQIDAEVDGTPGTNDMPGRLVFSTTADGASSPTERMRIHRAKAIGGNGTAQTL
jgi:hypothetical protein